MSLITVNDRVRCSECGATFNEGEEHSCQPLANKDRQEIEIIIKPGESQLKYILYLSELGYNINSVGSVITAYRDKSNIGSETGKNA